MSLKALKQLLLSKIESVYGTDPTPTGAANAIMVGNAKLVPLVQDALQRNLIRPYLGSDGKIVAGQHVGLDFDIEAAGSGTAGTAPAFAALLKACGLQEVTNATDVTGTAQAGGASSITLTVGASAADDAYKYFRVEITGGTGNGQVNYVRSYVGSTKVATMYEAWATPPDATSTYNIKAQNAYMPLSGSESSVTNYFNIDGMLHKMTGVRGDLSMKFAQKAIPLISLKTLGLYNTPSDTALAAPTFTNQKPVGCNNANTVAKLHGYAAIFADISLALGNQITYQNLIGAERFNLGDRKASGSVTIEHPAIAGKDFYSISQANTLGSLIVTHGTVSGNKLATYCPAVQLLSPVDGAVDNVRTLGLTLDVQPVDGNDEIIITVF